MRNLADWLAAAKATEGLWVYGAEVGAASPYTQADLTGPLVLVLGSEGKGIRPRVAAACDALVSIPVRGRTASLNVSVGGGGAPVRGRAAARATLSRLSVDARLGRSAETATGLALVRAG